VADWRIAIHVSKSSTIVFVKTGRRDPKPRSVQIYGKPIQLVATARHLGVILDKRLTWRHISIR
jgi:hypothetical protein